MHCPVGTVLDSCSIDVHIAKMRCSHARGLRRALRACVGGAGDERRDSSRGARADRRSSAQGSLNIRRRESCDAVAERELARFRAETCKDEQSALAQEMGHKAEGTASWRGLRGGRSHQSLDGNVQRKVQRDRSSCREGIRQCWRQPEAMPRLMLDAEEARIKHAIAQAGTVHYTQPSPVVCSACGLRGRAALHFDPLKRGCQCTSAVATTCRSYEECSVPGE